MVLLEVLRAADNDMSVFHRKCLPDLGGVCFKGAPWVKQNNGHNTSYMFHMVSTGFLSYMFMSVCWVFSLLNKIPNTNMADVCFGNAMSRIHNKLDMNIHVSMS